MFIREVDDHGSPNLPCLLYVYKRAKEGFSIDGCVDQQVYVHAYNRIDDFTSILMGIKQLDNCQVSVKMQILSFLINSYFLFHNNKGFR